MYAVLAFVNEVRWDPVASHLRPEVVYGVGRKMTTSPQNRISPTTDVTPDCVVQRSPAHGVVAEVKKGLPSELAYWEKEVRQLQKYDDDLRGWWTSNERVDNHDLVALVPLLRSVQFSDLINDGIGLGKWSFKRKLVTLGFQRQVGPEKTWMFLKKEGGALSDAEFDKRMRYGTQVNIGLLIELYGDRKFLDSAPMLPIILQILWDNLFTEYVATGNYESQAGATLLKLSAEQITTDLQKYYGFPSSGLRSPEIPKRRWVIEALDALVGFRLATSDGSGGYTIRYKRQKGDTLERFGRLCFRSKKPQNDSAGQGQRAFDFSADATKDQHEQ